MDISKEYIEMSDCSEIQGLWKPSEGDLAYSNRSGVYVLFEAVIKAGKFLGRFKKDHIWLPRQDQLQDMIDCFKFWGYSSEVPISAPDQIEEFNRKVCRSDYPYYRQFKSMEQLWLAFVMKEKFGKVWKEGKWE